MGVTNLQVFKTVNNKTERNNKVAHYIPGYYEQASVDFENFKTISSKHV